MHFVTCMVRLNGDLLNVVPRGEFNPVSWPEVDVLRTMHGEDSVIDVKAIAKVDQSAKAEKERLRQIYGADRVENIFPGKNPQMELEMPGAKIPEGVVWKNPIDIDPSERGVIDPVAKAAKAEKPEKAEKPAAKQPLPFN